MDLTDLQMMLIVVVVLITAALLVFIDYFREERQPQQSRSIKTPKTPQPQPLARIYGMESLEYAPARKQAARPLEQHRAKRPAPSFEMAPSSPAAPSETAMLPGRPAASDQSAAYCQNEKRPPSAQPAIEAPSSPLPPVMLPPVAVPPVMLPPVTVPPVTLPPVTIDASLWERLLASQNTTPGSASTVEPASHMIREEDSGGRQPAHSRGIVQAHAFQQLLESNQPFTGLVVSVGVNDSDGSTAHSQDLVESVGSYIATLLEENDIVCRNGCDEFIIVCPGQRGAPSQRRLNHISERLWDYQLRGLGACSILFTWGGVQVQNQSLADAVAAATDRMRETKRTGNSAGAPRKTF
jgi:GGDEF domain-containing protein